MIQLICDSGGTKSSWRLLDGERTAAAFDTDGMNPAVNTHESIQASLASLRERLTPYYIYKDISRVWFYGAGCAHGTAHVMRRMLEEIVPTAKVEVNSDMLGAARALCQNSEGIACILGTGANSCYYDGRDICQNTPSLGYILGDEGGGAVLGRMLVNRLYKGLFPPRLRQMFEEEMHTDLNTIIERVYRQPLANRYLASFTYFLSAHRDEECIHGMLTHCFTQFFQRNIRVYNHPELPVNFVGSLAFHFRDELEESAARESFHLGAVVQAPIADLVHFHLQNAID